MANRYSNQRPDDLGVENGRFKPCPNTPNCVSTQANPSDKQHFIEPILFTGSAREAIQKVAKIIGQKKRTQLVAQTDTYLHAEFTIAFFGFVDDVEFYADEQTHQLHFRSASRVGRGDLGVNRRRMNQFRKEFESL